NAGKRLQRLIRNFLVFTQMELVRSDPQELESLRAQKTEEAHIVVERSARDIADQLKRTADLSVQGETGTAAISSDLLRKIVEELIDNALKFSTSGKPIHVQSGA